MNIELISYCGLYCGSCPQLKKGKCLACKQKDKTTWCKIKNCCIANAYTSCADCDIADLNDCKKFNNLITKFFSFLFKSDRKACIEKIKVMGYKKYSIMMDSTQSVSISREKSNHSY